MCHGEQGEMGGMCETGDCVRVMSHDELCASYFVGSLEYMEGKKKQLLLGGCGGRVGEGFEGGEGYCGC